MKPLKVPTFSESHEQNCSLLTGEYIIFIEVWEGRAVSIILDADRKCTMFRIREKSHRLIIQGEAHFNVHTWFLGIGPLATPFLIVAGAISGLLAGKLYLQDYLNRIVLDRLMQMLISAAGGVIIFVIVFALLAASIRFGKRRITIDAESRTIRWHDLFNKRWRFQKTFDDVSSILVYRTKENLLISRAYVGKYRRRHKSIYLPVTVYYAQFKIGDKGFPLMSSRSRRQAQAVAKRVADFIDKPLEDRSDVSK